MQKVELLAPSGDSQSFYGAISAGADAIYLGTKKFNARASAKNFFEDELAYLVKYAHLLNIKVYVTMNTIIFDEEFESIYKTVEELLSVGIDAFIVQDIGLVMFIKKHFKDAHIHASTQMAINNVYGALWAKENGIERIVLSRECSIEEIKKIKEITNLEIEFFIQGALCVCFSGNCFLSEENYSRSGNRGECAQPCRLLYKAFDGNKFIGEGYYLSAKDFCMGKRISDLISAGVDSFKIEGRARRPYYIYNATKIYRNVIDKKQFTDEDLTNLKISFNRGNFCEGYLDGNKNQVYFKTQSHIGFEIGNVLSVKIGKRFNEVLISSKIKLEKKDTLKFFCEEIEKNVATIYDLKEIEKNKYYFTTTQIIEKGWSVNLISRDEDKLFEKKPIKITLEFISKENEKAFLNTNVMNKNYSVCSQQIIEMAKNNITSEDEINNQLKKGFDNFFVEKIKINKDNVFIPKSILNSMRRNLSEIIEKDLKIAEKNEINAKKFENVSHVKNNTNNLMSKIIKNYDEIENGFDCFILKPDDYLKFSYNKELNKKENIYLDLPNYLTTKEIEILNDICKTFFDGVVVNNISHIYLFNNFDIIAGYYLNVKNNFFVEYLKEKNINKLLAIKDYENLNIGKVFVKNFEIDLMTTVSCPFQTLFGCNCSHCKFFPNLILKGEDKKEYLFKRKKVANCYFNLVYKN